MNIEEFRTYCLSKPFVTEEFPFGEDTLVFKVKGKMFALTGLDREGFSVNLKCDPDYGEELREKYPEIQAGYHMNKKLWNTVDFEGSLPPTLLMALIDHSFSEVVKKMPKKEQF